MEQVNHKIKNRGYLLIVLPLLFFILLYCYPLIKIFYVSFAKELTLIHLKKHFNGLYFRIVWFTFWQASLSTILTLTIALPGIYIFTKYKFPGKGVLQALITLPFVLPSIIIASAFEALLGQYGFLNTFGMRFFHLSAPIINIEKSIWFFLLAHMFYNYAIMFHIIGKFWQSLTPNIVESAKALGASSWQIFWRITFPLLKPAILAASILVFIFCFSSFGIILILGGARFNTIEVEIFRQAIHLFNLPTAAILSVTQMIFTFIMLLIYTSIQKKHPTNMHIKLALNSKEKITSFKTKLFVGANLFVIILFIGLPIFALVLSSFSTPNGFSFINYKKLFINQTTSIFSTPPIEAIGNSFVIACTTALFATVLGLLSATYLARYRQSRLLESLFILPMATSAVILGFGIVVVTNHLPSIRNSFLLLPMVHTLIAFPFVLKCFLPPLKSIPPNIREAASVLGANNRQIWQKIDLPIIEQAIIIGIVFAFTISFGEFGASSFLAKTNMPTISTAIYRFLSGNFANYGLAMAMSTILMITTIFCFVIITKRSAKKSLVNYKKNE